MIKIFLIFFFSMHIANNLSATDVPEQLFVERTTLYSAYDSRTDRIICDPAKLAEFRAKLGNLPFIQNSEDPELSCETFSDASTEKYLFAPLDSVVTRY